MKAEAVKLTWLKAISSGPTALALHLQARRIDGGASRGRSLRNRVTWVTVVLLAVLMSAPDLARAVETITSLTTIVTTRLDGSAEVVEVIDVIAEGDEIKHGIYVDLPVSRRSGLGHISAEVSAVGVLRDGEPEGFSLETPVQGVLRIKMGKSDVPLPPGPHRYKLRYLLSNAVSRMADRQIIGWELGRWHFPIEAATISIALPDVYRTLDVLGVEAGAPAAEVQIERPSDHQATLLLQRPLAPGGEFRMLVFAEISSEGQAVQGPRLQRVVAGPAHSCALTVNGVLYCWDIARANGTIAPSAMRVENLPALKDFDLGDNGEGCGLDRAGKLWCWVGWEMSGAEEVRAANVKAFVASVNFVKVSAGFAHTCALDDEGGVWCIGSNADGELGTGDTVSHPDELVKVNGLGPAIDVSAGVNNTCVVLAVGQAWCWGTDSPATGAKLLFETPVPNRIDDVSGLVAVHNGRNFMCGIEEAAIDCWGSNISGQLGTTREILGGRIAGIIRAPTATPTSIGAGMFSACVVSGEGMVFCWGAWDDTEITDMQQWVEGIPSAKAVSVNINKACILAMNDQVWCWGDRPSGQTGRTLNSAYTSTPWQIVIPFE